MPPKPAIKTRPATAGNKENEDIAMNDMADLGPSRSDPPFRYPIVISPTTSTPIGAIRRSNSLKRNNTILSRYEWEENMVNYNTIDYPHSDHAGTTAYTHSNHSRNDDIANENNLENGGSPEGQRMVYITAVNTASLPRRSHSTASQNILSPFRRAGPPSPTKLEAPSPIKNSESNTTLRPSELTPPNQFRAFSRRAYSFQKRQWFTNICCISLCPFFIILVAFALQLIISSLANTGAVSGVQYLYCSAIDSINQQQWPIYNLNASGIKNLPATSYPGAVSTVKHLNFLDRSIFIELTSVDSLNKYASMSLMGSATCANWFGEQYPTSPSDIYRLAVSPAHNYSTKDSMYTNEILSGWLDVLTVDANAPAIYQSQANSLARSFAIYQTRPWYLVAWDSSISASSIGSVNQSAPLSSTSSLPTNAVPYFKRASLSNGLLDTIEPRWYARVSPIPPSLSGFEQVPYFLTNFSDASQFNSYISKSVETTVTALGTIDTSAIVANLGDLALAQVLGQLQNALQITPYGSIYFKQINHTNKTYSYTLQFGTDPRLKYTPGFPSTGMRRMIAQMQLTNALLRFSNPGLENTVITQGTRAFPILTNPTPSINYGSIIGRILYPLGISFLLPIFTIALVREKENRILVMMRMNGLGDVSGYYIANYITFFLNYTVSTIIFVLVGAAFKLDLFLQTQAGVIFIVFFLWGHLQVSLAFFFAAIFKTSRSAIVAVFLITICSVISSYILDQVFTDPNEYPFWIFVWPPFVFYRILGILNIYATSARLNAYTVSMLVSGDAVFNAIMVISAEIVAVLLLSIYLTQVLPQEFGPVRPWNYPYLDFKKQPKESTKIQDIAYDPEELKSEDDDVRAERNRIKSGDYDSDAPLILNGMRKSYGTKLVVRDATFAVEKGTVFGLLGPNGAGKTSLISILTGVYNPTSGQAILGGYDSAIQSAEAFQSIGVCPQFDTLWDDLNISEHLFFYARLKGVPVKLEREAVQAALDLVDLFEHKNQLIKHLSGGQKRRVSIAIALVADPKVVFLDEPTTGLDPEVRRTVWDTIARARGNRAILLTTHSMEEAEVCCQKIGIMARGTLRCIGPAARLKSLYGPGYDIEIMFHNPGSATIFMEAVLPEGWKLVQDMRHLKRFTFVPKNFELAKLFENMQNAHEATITTWGITQTTLDAIFSNILKEDDM